MPGGLHSFIRVASMSTPPFTSMFIEAKARDKQASSSTSLSVAQLQREAKLFCERLAMVMTKENRPKVEYPNASLVFQDNTDPFLEFFGRGGSEVSVLELVQTCSPLTKAQETLTTTPSPLKGNN